MECQALRACSGTPTLTVASDEGFFIHSRHVQSYVGAGVDVVVDVEKFFIIIVVAAMW